MRGVWLIGFVFLGLAAGGQDVPPLDKSPMDMSYFPVNYPVLKIQNKSTGSPVMRVIYSRPQKAGRQIFGGLVKYGELWRMGANEATELEVFSPVRIGGRKISRGRYTLYAVVNEQQWTFIVNRETDTWGAFKYDPRRDVVRVQVPATRTVNPLEYLAIFFEKSATGANLIVEWDHVRVALPIVL
ncbi:MAG TPA: DUF2911 domain-containing protein [Chitinophagaceae bacterium]|nr:DUF2911 domain-containing protein [Chitinophagaceae bacterium]